MKYCPNCGKKIDGDSNFCDNCGNQVSDNINDKPNSNNSHKSISDIINPILARPKLLLVIIIVLIVIMGVNFIFNSNSVSNSDSNSVSNSVSNSGSNIFGGQEINVYGVNFHIPDGFTYYSLPGTSTKTESQFALYSSDGKKALAFIHIKVSDTSSAYSAEKSYTANSKMTINGKECYVNTGSSSSVFCAYDTNNGKTVQLNVPKSYKYNNKLYSYEDTLAEMIK